MNLYGQTAQPNHHHLRIAFPRNKLVASHFDIPYTKLCKLDNLIRFSSYSLIHTSQTTSTLKKNRFTQQNTVILKFFFIKCDMKNLQAIDLDARFNNIQMIIL